MADLPKIPTLRVSGAAAIVTALYVVAIFGTLHLVAISHPNSRFGRAWLALGF